MSFIADLFSCISSLDAMRRVLSNAADSEVEEISELIDEHRDCLASRWTELNDAGSFELARAALLLIYWIDENRERIEDIALEERARRVERDLRKAIRTPCEQVSIRMRSTRIL